MADKSNLVIVESPAKAKTLKKFLGSAYKIEASVGHVRDLPKSQLGIDVENDFEPKYITIRGKGDVLSKLRKEAKSASRIYLATDPDREGEAISWHLMHALKLDGGNTSRITFNEITKNAVRRSIKEARDINMDLVNAQQARRGLDRIVGYGISPLLWKKVKKGLSAGRVQSAALKMICDREDEIENFNPEEYWTLNVILSTGKSEKVTACYYPADNGKRELSSAGDVDALLSEIKGKKFTVREVKKGARIRKPLAPFTTSTLQQEASRVLGFTTGKTMMTAQQLYEGVETKEGAIGLVTYIRTDSVRVSDEAYAEAKDYIGSNYGADYVSPERPVYKSKGRSQDAHEAIRPAYMDKSPESLKSALSRDHYLLYKLIWKRFMASQMAPAVYDTVNVRITAGDVVFRASGSVLRFDGFLAVYEKNEMKSEGEDAENVKIPELEAGQALKPVDYKPEQHFTQPPPRYNEASLVRTMEEIGIGRPSTYAATIGTIMYRRYVSKEKKLFYPTELGAIVNEIMSENFDNIVNIDFTAKMEENLDRVEDGEADWKEIIRGFYYDLEEKIKAAEERIGEIEVEDEKTDVICENCGRNMVIKFGRYGQFLACPGFPECKNAKPFFEEAGVACPVCKGRTLIKKTKKGRRYFGCENNPECEFMSWKRPTGETCPECGSYLVEKGSRDKKAACSNAGCRFSKELAIAEEA